MPTPIGTGRAPCETVHPDGVAARRHTAQSCARRPSSSRGGLIAGRHSVRVGIGERAGSRCGTRGRRRDPLPRSHASRASSSRTRHSSCRRLGYLNRPDPGLLRSDARRPRRDARRDRRRARGRRARLRALLGRLRADGCRRRQLARPPRRRPERRAPAASPTRADSAARRRSSNGSVVLDWRAGSESRPLERRVSEGQHSPHRYAR